MENAVQNRHVVSTRTRLRSSASCVAMTFSLVIIHRLRDAAHQYVPAGMTPPTCMILLTRNYRYDSTLAFAPGCDHPG